MPRSRRTIKRARTRESSANTNTETAREVETTPAQEPSSIRVQRVPPRSDPEGMTTIRTRHGWVTIPSEWLKPDASAADVAALGRVLDLACKVSPLS